MRDSERIAYGRGSMPWTEALRHLQRVYQHKKGLKHIPQHLLGAVKHHRLEGAYRND